MVAASVSALCPAADDKLCELQTHTTAEIQHTPVFRGVSPLLASLSSVTFTFLWILSLVFFNCVVIDKMKLMLMLAR